MTDISFGDVLFNGKPIGKLTGPPEMNYDGKEFIDEHVDDSGRQFPGKWVLHFSKPIQHRQWVRMQLVFDGGHPHRSHRVTARRQKRLDQERKRKWRWCLDSHLRWKREAAFAEAIRVAKEQRIQVEVTIPFGGLDVTVCPPKEDDG